VHFYFYTLIRGVELVRMLVSGANLTLFVDFVASIEVKVTNYEFKF